MPFELTGVLLLAAIIGVVVLGKKKRRRVTMPSTVTIEWYLALSVILFTLGATWRFAAPQRDHHFYVGGAHAQFGELAFRCLFSLS